MGWTLAIAALLFLAAPALAQNEAAGAGPPVAFGEVTGVDIPLQSVSGRFSSLNPLDRRNCAEKEASGRVVSPTLLMVDGSFCGRRAQTFVLVNVQFRNPRDGREMVTGRRVDIHATFKRAVEAHGKFFIADFVIAENAALAGADPLDRSAPPAPAFTSYMMCQPPELDALATGLGSDLCVQNTLVANLAVTGAALEAAAKAEARAPSKMPPEDTVPGDANAILCGPDPGVSDRHLTAIDCARASYWRWYKALKDPTFSAPPAPP